MWRTRLTRLTVVGGLTWAVSGFVVAGPANAGAPAPCELQKAGSPASELKSEPWGQERLGFIDAWRLTRGKGVSVAVIDSGVDTTHPQLAGQVKDYDVTKTGKRDCVGHGTRVVGIIGAKDMRSRHIPFVGVAPEAKIISIKASPQADGNDPKFVVDALRAATRIKAKVINVSSKTPNYPALQAAIEEAQRAGCLIVAAAGNVDDAAKGTVEAAYPAAYPGVVSVGSVGKDGQLDRSDTQTRVTVTAPGTEIISTWPGGRYDSDSGTSFATPFVAGVAALVRSYHPELTAAQVKHRLEVTSDGGTARGTGSGMINPLQAVSAILPEESKSGAAPLRAQPVAISRPHGEDPFRRNLALSLTGATLAVAAGVAVGGVVLPAARRRAGSARRAEAVTGRRRSG